MAGPFACIVLISMVKDAFEDYQRHKRDSDENYDTVEVYDKDSEKFIEKVWASIKVGDLIKLSDGSSVPADILALYSNDANGQVFVETKSLDGETNLKIKSVPREINAKYYYEDKLEGGNLIFNLQARITTE